MIRISAADHDMFAHLLGLFSEAGHSVDQFAGGNEFYVPDDLVIEDEDLHAEIVRAVRPGTPVPPLAPRPPGGGDSPAPSEPTSSSATPPGSSTGVEAATTGQAVRPPLPPKAGPGSNRDAWVEAAEARKIVVTDDMTRADIMQAVEESDDR
jgi:hypothetical protein